MNDACFYKLLKTGYLLNNWLVRGSRMELFTLGASQFVGFVDLSKE